MFVTELTDRLLEEGGTAILVHKAIDHFAVPDWLCKYLETTAIHLELATRQAKFVLAYISPT
jgi:hypothetical protein